LLEEMLNAVERIRRPQGRPRKRPKKLHAYSRPTTQRKKCRKALRRRGIKSKIARKGKERGEKLEQHRWVAERTLSWLNRYRHLKGRYEGAI
jgi:hypothetical protein